MNNDALQVALNGLDKARAEGERLASLLESETATWSRTTRNKDAQIETLTKERDWAREDGATEFENCQRYVGQVVSLEAERDALAARVEALEKAAEKECADLRSALAQSKSETDEEWKRARAAQAACAEYRDAAQTMLDVCRAEGADFDLLTRVVEILAKPNPGDGLLANLKLAVERLGLCDCGCELTGEVHDLLSQYTH